jgi:hypothetical protein
MQKKRRSLNQIKEDISIRILRSKLPKEWVIHQYGEDYGIDCVVEIFDFIDEEKNVAETLGENFFVQLKSSSHIEYATRKAYSRGNVAKGALKKSKDSFTEIEVAKFQLDMPDILTVQSMGLAIPVLLILIDTNTERAFFVCINDYIDKVLIPEDPNYSAKGSKTIHIPTANEILDEKCALVPLRVYGKRPKMYGAFALFNYQLNEIRHMLDRVNAQDAVQFKQSVDMIKTFVDILLRQDIWSQHEFWEPISHSHKELLGLRDKLVRCNNSEDFRQLLAYLPDFTWNQLSNMSNLYEELVREWFMPTYLSQLISGYQV